jgi:hypothetical protein
MDVEQPTLELTTAFVASSSLVPKGQCGTLVIHDRGKAQVGIFE